MSRWFLVRHCETDWNAGPRIQGHSDVPLSDAGQRQASLLAYRLNSVSFAAAYSSDLSRSVQTGQAILWGKDIALQSMPELRELSYGEWEGMTAAELQARQPDLYAQLLTGDLKFAPPGGESVEDLVRRVQALVGRLQAEHSGPRDILLVGHGGSLRGLAISLLGLPVECFWRFRLAPASLSIVSVYPNGAALDLWNDTSHLEGRGES